MLYLISQTTNQSRNCFIKSRGKVHIQGQAYSRLPSASKMEHFATTVNGFYPLIIVAKLSILDV